MFTLPCFTEELSIFPWMLHQPYRGHNLALLTGKALSYFHVTLKCFRRSIRAGPGTSMQRTVSVPCVTPWEVIYMHVNHCCSGAAEPLFDRKSVPAADKSPATSLAATLGLSVTIQPLRPSAFGVVSFWRPLFGLIWSFHPIETSQLQPRWLL